MPTPQPPKNLRGTYIAPKPPYMTPILLCGAIMVLSSRREIIAPGSFIYDHVLANLGANAPKYATWVQNGLFYLFYGSHVIETAMFTRRLSKNGVSAGSWAWWKWMATCFMGGKFCFAHFDREVGKLD